MSNRVVCISHTVAAGGERIGHAVAERLGFRYVDDEVILVAAEKAGVDPAVVAKAEQHTSLLTRLLDALVSAPVTVEGYFAKADANDYYPSASPHAVKPPGES